MIKRLLIAILLPLIISAQDIAGTAFMTKRDRSNITNLQSRVLTLEDFANSYGPRVEFLEANTGNWNSAYSWGNHALVGYLTTNVVNEILLGYTTTNVTDTIKTNLQSQIDTLNTSINGLVPEFSKNAFKLLNITSNAFVELSTNNILTLYRITYSTVIKATFDDIVQTGNGISCPWQGQTFYFAGPGYSMESGYWRLSGIPGDHELTYFAPGLSYLWISYGNVPTTIVPDNIGYGYGVGNVNLSYYQQSITNSVKTFASFADMTNYISSFGFRSAATNNTEDFYPNNNPSNYIDSIIATNIVTDLIQPILEAPSNSIISLDKNYLVRVENNGNLSLYNIVEDPMNGWYLTINSTDITQKFTQFSYPISVNDFNFTTNTDADTSYAATIGGASVYLQRITLDSQWSWSCLKQAVTGDVIPFTIFDGNPPGNALLTYYSSSKSTNLIERFSTFTELTNYLYTSINSLNINYLSRPNGDGSFDVIFADRKIGTIYKGWNLIDENTSSIYTNIPISYPIASAYDNIYFAPNYYFKIQEILGSYWYIVRKYEIDEFGTTNTTESWTSGYHSFPDVLNSTLEPGELNTELLNWRLEYVSVTNITGTLITLEEMTNYISQGFSTININVSNIVIESGTIGGETLIGAESVTNIAFYKSNLSTQNLINASTASNISYSITGMATQNLASIESLYVLMSTSRIDKVWENTNTWWEFKTNTLVRINTNPNNYWTFLGETENLGLPYPLVETNFGLWHIAGVEGGVNITWDYIESAYWYSFTASNSTHFTLTSQLSEEKEVIYNFTLETNSLIYYLQTNLIPPETWSKTDMNYWANTNQMTYTWITNWMEDGNAGQIWVSDLAAIAANVLLSDHRRATNAHEGVYALQTGGTLTNATLAGTVTFTNGLTFGCGYYTNGPDFGIFYSRNGTNYWELLK